jgi:hypothetical protein
LHEVQIKVIVTINVNQSYTTANNFRHVVLTFCATLPNKIYPSLSCFIDKPWG